MNRAPWTVAVLVGLAVHAPLALALFSAAPEGPRDAPPVSPQRPATIDLRSWTPPVVTRPRSRARAFVASRGGGGRGPFRSESVGRRARAIVRLPDRAPEATPAARPVAILEGLAARSDAELGPSGVFTGRGGPGGGSGTGAGTGPGTGSTFEVNEVDVPPRRISGAEPSYPRLDAMAGREGFVTLEFVVREDGTVSDVTFLSHQGPRSFVESAREAVTSWRFSPAQRGGRAVACLCTQRLAFQLGERR